MVAAGEVLFDEGERTVAQIATAMEGSTTATAALEVNIYTDAFLASVFDHANLSVAKAASIIDNANMLVNVVAAMADSVNISSARILAFLDTGSLTDTDKIAALLDGTSLTLANAITHVESETYTAAQYYDAFDSAQLGADRTQSILYGMTLAAWLVDILTSGAGDLTVAGDTEINGVNRYELLTVNGGITLTLALQPAALIVDTIANSGNIVKKLSGGAAGAAGGDNIGDGGQGAGGFVIFADVLGSSGIISADGEVGKNGTTVTVGGNGGNGGAGEFHRVGADVPGTGGNGAYRVGDEGFRGDGGVDGGGAGSHDAARSGGDGGGSVLTTPASYAALAVKIRQYAIDWVIVNVFGKAPGATVSINVYGSGGGGGAGENVNAACGGGGGGGGEVLALCLTLNNTGTIRANSGIGGNGGTEGPFDNEGGGGGGGLVYILYVALTAAGVLQANGAAAGAGDSNDTVGQPGGNGVAMSQDVS